MSKSLARLIALMLALWTAVLSMNWICTALADVDAAGARFDGASQRESGEPDKLSTDGAPESTHSNEPSSAADEPEPTQKPDAGSAPAAGAQTPAVMPSETPAAAPAQTPAEPPSETPAAPEDAFAGAYLVSPGEAIYTMGSFTPLTFAIAPPDAPFIGMEGMECAYADGIVTLGVETLDALGEGEHILTFLFEGGARVEVPLKVTAAQMVAKGSMEYLFIGGKEYNGGQLIENRSNPEQHWSWNAATATLTLNGYNGGRIHARGMTALTVATAAGSVNTIASSEEGSLFSDYGLKLTGGGTLNISNDTGSAVLCEDSILIEGGTVWASGKKSAFRSKRNEIRVRGGRVDVIQKGRQGDGFSAKNSTLVSGGSVNVEGAGTAFGSLVVSGGSVTIRDCETGASGGLSASGGHIVIEDVARSAAAGEQAMRFTDCTLSIIGCGDYGLYSGGDLTVGKGASLRIEANKIALCAPGRASTLRIEKGANLDLSGGECALKGRKVVIGGKEYTEAYNHVVIQNGAIVRRENAIQSLTVGGRTYGASSLSGDLSGGGWAWAATSRTLTLNGYDGGAVSAIGSPITLTLEGGNAIGGDLTVSGVIVTGGGALAVSRVVGNAGFEIRSGTVSAAKITLGGDLTVSGGEVRLCGDGDGAAAGCKNFLITGGGLILSSSDGSRPEGIRASGAAAIRGGAVTVKSFGDFLRAAGDAVISGGSVRIGDNTGAGIASGKNIKATGGDITIRTNLCAMTANGILISGKPSVRLESASRTAFDAKSVKIAGKAYAPRYPGVIIEGGKLVESYKLLPDLIIDGWEYSMKELNAGDRSGDGWNWSARRNTLTLSGYQGKGIWINRNLTLALAPGTTNRASGDYRGGEAALYSTEDLALTGSGRWSGGLYSEARLRIAGSPSIAASAIGSRDGVAILGGRVQVTGSLAAEDGDVLIENSRVTAGRVRGARVELRKSSLTTTAGEDGGPDLAGDTNLVISGSIVFCTHYAAPGGKTTISGSPVFLRGASGGEEVWILAQNASITRDMAVPPGKDCLVPAGRTLSIAKGKRLYVYGSLAVDGTLKGAVIRRSEAGRIVIQGSAQVAQGRSVHLTAQVVPAIPDGQADQAVSWSSDSPGLLSVSDEGVVTATALSKPGDTASITCRAMDGTGVEGTALMTVTEPTKKLTILCGGAVVSRLNASRSAGMLELDVRINPEGASSRVRWTSSNSNVASVDPDEGTVLLLKKGTAAIACAATDGTNVKAIVRLTVE